MIRRRKTTRFVIAEGRKPDVAISQYPSGAQESHRRNRRLLQGDCHLAPMGPRNDKSGDLAP